MKFSERSAKAKGFGLSKAFFRYLPFTVLGFTACDLVPGFTPSASLKAGSGPAPLIGPNCASCHQYPLTDVHHIYHLVSNNVNSDNLGRPQLNGYTTCMDCHFNSIRHFSYFHYDTVWVDVNGDTLYQHTSPTDRIGAIHAYHRYHPLPYGVFDTTQGEALADSIDTLIVQKSRVGKLVEWMTSTAHDNGQIDVIFAPNDVDADSVVAAFHPKDLSCSTIACHNAPDVYRWANASMGLSQCPSVDGLDTTCALDTTLGGLAP